MSRLDAFDADVLIYAVIQHPLGTHVRLLFHEAAMTERLAGVGSVLLMPEVLSKPLREAATDEVDDLSTLLALLDLRPTDVHIARAATALASTYRLKAADAVHLATAVVAGADRFITNNRRDFPKSISEIDITYPDDLLDREPK
jgi:predicted nucleic acid-binding protein